MTASRQPRNDRSAQKCAFHVAITLAVALTATSAAAADERQALTVSGAQPPVRISRATVLTPAQGPPLVLYAAESLAEEELDQFTVMAFVFGADGTLKARQVAPGRRSLAPKETKYSTLVIDGAPVDPTDIIVIGVNQAQRVGSESWWRADLQPAAEKAVPLKKR